MSQGTVQLQPYMQRRVTSSQSLRISLSVLIAGCSLALSCTTPGKPSEAPPSQTAEAPQVAQALQVAQPQAPAKLPPPTLNAVQQAVKRIFKETAVVDTSCNPNFIAGDFNGDLSQDIAVVLKPASGKLREMNEEFPGWILKDPFASTEPGMPPLRVSENEELLAVIHGYGSNGWRDPEATQTYLLKNAVGSGMEAHPGKEFVATNHGKKLPLLQGDLIGAVLRGASGYLYYSHSTYSWYNPKTFKGEPERALVHMPRAR